MAALISTAPSSGRLMNGRDENSEWLGLRQLHAWKSGESARNVNARARV
jgi:hypothetical protein